MKNQYSKVIQNYFSDYVNWLLAVSFLFIVSFVATVAYDGGYKFIWLIPLLFLVIYLLSIPQLILYLKANRDAKAGNIKKHTIEILEIRYDDRFVFKNRGGARVGKAKYRIVDSNNDVYLLSTSNKNDMFITSHPQPAFHIEIEFLSNSRLVLSMRIIECSKTIKEVCVQQHNITHFKKVFRHYFYS